MGRERGEERGEGGGEGGGEGEELCSTIILSSYDCCMNSSPQRTNRMMRMCL